MAMPVLPSPSNFLAVALVINRLRDGPRFVFHYPAVVLPVEEQARFDGDEDDFDDHDLFFDRVARPPSLGNTSGSLPNPSELAQWNRDDHLLTESGTQIVPWEHVAGFPTKALEGILTPARAYHKSLFHVSLDPVHCVSYPIYAPENGIWRKKKKKKKQQQQQQQARPGGPAKRRPDDDGGPGDSDAHGQSGDGAVGASDEGDAAAAARTTRAADPEDKVSSMTMFNLVFILNPKKQEVTELVDTMYSHIIKKVNKAYKYCQQRSDFVWKESKRILTLKDKAREDSTWARLLLSPMRSLSLSRG